jgi:hypothetical protein
LDDLLITPAAAKISRQVISDLLFRWLRAFVEQGFGGQDKSRSAVAALQGSEFHEGFLEWMKGVPLA